MCEKSDQAGPSKPKSNREAERDARLKAALKANMGRRKAQARARAVVDSVDHAEPGTDNNENE